MAHWHLVEMVEVAPMVQPDNRFRRLPEPVRLEDTIATQDADPLPDPEAGRDTDTDFLLRYN